MNKSLHRFYLSCAAAVSLLGASSFVQAQQPLAIADVHVHYSHDSVEMTPPQRVIEIMRAASLKFALVSSSDDNGTQLLSKLAPDLIIPGLRPYRRRGELSTWFTDPGALAYVEKLLATNRYASLGEFHLYGDDANLEIPQRIVELADQHNLILHAHSDAQAIDNLLALNPNVKVLWAHAGFDSPDEIAQMLTKHDRLWADLAFRGEVGSGGLDESWIKLFTDFPDRLMLGTDTYTPERIFYIPEQASSAREWLKALPDEIAERVAWKNAHDLLMPVWLANRDSDGMAAAGSQSVSCEIADNDAAGTAVVMDGDLSVKIQPQSAIDVSAAFAVQLTLCGNDLRDTEIQLDATMPKHGHGMNYTPESTVTTHTDSQLSVRFDGVLLHMPGTWQWQVNVVRAGVQTALTHDFEIQ